MNRKFRRALSTAALAALAPTMASANIDIVFDYTYDTGSFFDATRKSVLEAAALVFESRITDSLGAITSDASLDFTANFFNPSNLGGANISIGNFSVAAGQLTVFVGADALGGSTLGVGGPGGFGLSGFDFSSISRGQAGYTPLAASVDTDFAPWGGSLTFNNSANWYFDTDVSTTESFAGQSDFYSVALHELNHLLGLGTAESWSSKIAGTTFNGPNAGTVTLDPGLGHWLEGTTSSIDGAGAFETLMDPSITVGTRKLMTDLDWNGLRDVGWEVSVTAVPEASTSLMLLAGLAGLGLLRARRQPSVTG